jgi:hypothetical protein
VAADLPFAPAGLDDPARGVRWTYEVPMVRWWPPRVIGLHLQSPRHMSLLTYRANRFGQNSIQKVEFRMLARPPFLTSIWNGVDVVLGSYNCVKKLGCIFLRLTHRQARPFML